MPEPTERNVSALAFDAENSATRLRDRLQNMLDRLKGGAADGNAEEKARATVRTLSGSLESVERDVSISHGTLSTIELHLFGIDSNITAPAVGGAGGSGTGYGGTSLRSVG